MSATVTISASVRDELEDLCAGYSLAFALLAEANATGRGEAVASAGTADKYKAAMAQMKDTDARVEALRKREWPRFGLSVTTMGALLHTTKTYRGDRRVYDRPHALWVTGGDREVDA